MLAYSKSHEGIICNCIDGLHILKVQLQNLFNSAGEKIIIKTTLYIFDPLTCLVPKVKCSLMLHKHVSFNTIRSLCSMEKQEYVVLLLSLGFSKNGLN